MCIYRMSTQSPFFSWTLSNSEEHVYSCFLDASETAFRIWNLLCGDRWRSPRCYNYKASSFLPTTFLFFTPISSPVHSFLVEKSNHRGPSPSNVQTGVMQRPLPTFIRLSMNTSASTSSACCKPAWSGQANLSNTIQPLRISKGPTTQSYTPDSVAPSPWSTEIGSKSHFL